MVEQRRHRSDQDRAGIMADVPSTAEQQSGRLDSCQNFERNSDKRWTARMKKKSQKPNQPRPTAALILARTIIRTGFRHKDRRLLKAGQAWYLNELATIFKQCEECEQPELPFEDGPSTSR
jgi:hypothetical protein